LDGAKLKAFWQAHRRGALILAGSVGASLSLWHLFGSWVGVAAISAGLLLLALVEPARETVPRKRDVDEAARQVSAARVGVAVAVLAGAVGVTTHAVQFGSVAAFLAVGSGAAVVGGASLVVGSLLGFLFGIPRSAAGEAAPASSGQAVAKGSGDAAAQAPVEYRANTNLEQISDWLTKILVGVGLTQLTKVPELLQQYSETIKPLLGGTTAAGTFGVALSVYFFITGFMIGYLWTRLALGGALRAADLAAIGQRTANVESKLQKLERQAVLDANALGMATAVLSPGADTPQPTQEALEEALRAASPPVRVQIFYRAAEQRAANWRDAANKAKVARVIPIFRALVASDPEDRYHRNHAELGYALKDQPTPDWSEAEAELSKAIAIRGDPAEHGWVIYEFARALCRIHQDQGYAAQRPSTKEARQEILRDLRVSLLARNLRSTVLQEPSVSEWLRLNEVAEKELRLS